MADDSGIDSRYAAQFQRGFDPTRHAESPTQRGPVRREGGPPATAPRVADPPRMAPSPAVTETDAVVPASPDDTDDTALTAPTWWDWLLPGVGAGLVLIAFMLWWSLGTDTSHYDGTGTYDEWSVFLQQVLYMLPGPLLTAGMIAMTGGIVLQAVRPRR